MSIHPLARGFAAAADDYARARPSYPDDALRWLATQLDLRPGRTVVDLAAGTGKLTELLVRTGASVMAVEPVAEMRQRLAATLPEVPLLAGVAEALALEDEAVDAATVGQAFHWFDGDRALREIHRVLRARGRLAVVYNRRPFDHPVHATVEEIIAPFRGEAPAQQTGEWRAAFGRSRSWAPVDEAEFSHVQLARLNDVVARVASTSFIADLPAQRRADVLSQVRSRFEGYAEPIAIPYLCEVYVWRRL